MDTTVGHIDLAIMFYFSNTDRFNFVRNDCRVLTDVHQFRHSVSTEVSNFILKNVMPNISCILKNVKHG